MMRMIEQNFKHSLNLPLQSQANLMPCLQDSEGRVGHGNFRKLFNPLEENKYLSSTTLGQDTIQQTKKQERSHNYHTTLFNSLCFPSYFDLIHFLEE